LHLAGAFFVTRAKSNMDSHRVYSAPVDRAAGIICDQTIALGGHYTAKSYPEHLRRIRFRGPETAKTLIFLTNQFGLPAATVCALYKSRWQVELFFKWIKQHLRIKRFYGTSENRASKIAEAACLLSDLLAGVCGEGSASGNLGHFQTSAMIMRTRMAIGDCIQKQTSRPTRSTVWKTSLATSAD
jgi:hypothetical protein